VGNEPAASDSRRYAAMLLFQFRVVTSGVSDRRRLCEKRLILIRARDGRSALRAAKRQGRAAQHNYVNAKGGQVRFEFVGVLDLLHLGPQCGPNEVWYQLCRLQDRWSGAAGCCRPSRSCRLSPKIIHWAGASQDDRSVRLVLR
jgi:hypothetical protein